MKKMFARFLAPKKIHEWLQELPQRDGIYLLSEDAPFQHPEDDYDKQYGHDQTWIDERLGADLIAAMGFIPENVLEIACGTGHVTASLLHDGRTRRLVASDASEQFLKITKRKVAMLPTANRLDLLRLSDAEFDAIPAGIFDAILMRSALHHFDDFKTAAATLISKVKSGGAFLMLEPRADFHVTSSLILKCAKAKAAATNRPWTEVHERQAKGFVDMAELYLGRGRDKGFAEDKHVFHLEEMLEIADSTGTNLRILGGEGDARFSDTFRLFMKHCMSFDQIVLDDVVSLAADELAFMDEAYKSRPRYAAAEWFLFRR